MANGSRDGWGRTRTPTDDRRRYPRYRLRLPVNIHFDDKQRGCAAILMDLSAGGFLVRTRARSVPGNTIHVKLQSYDNRSFEMDGQVVRIPCIPQPGGFAVRFSPESAELTSLLDEVNCLPLEDRAHFIAGELRPFIEVTRN